MSQQQHGEEGLPEWIMSYADMITILMAFFVVMYSMAGDKSEQKEQAVMESLRTWLGPLRPPHATGQEGWGGAPGGFPGIQPRGLAKHGNEPAPGPEGEPTGSSHWRAVRSLGGSIYAAIPAAELNAEQQQQLEQIAKLLTGKRQLIEIHCVPSPRLAASAQGRKLFDEGWSKCLLVLDRLVELGIEQRRIQIQIASPGNEPADRALLNEDTDFRVDINLVDRFLHDSSAAASAPK